jgi:transcriptional regulator GlxA family with amidase domain
MSAGKHEEKSAGKIMRRIVISGPPPVQVLDVTGPLEVFSNLPDYQVVVVASDRSAQLQTNRGIHLAGAVPRDSVIGPIDTLVVAGGPGAENGEYDDAYLRWISDASSRSRRVASICTGAFILAAAGLLDGKRVVTHWSFCDRLAREFPKVNVLPNPIFLRDGPIYTSAGITAGIDLSLALVEEDHGHQAALAVARQLVMFLVRPGGQAQYSHMLSRQATTSEPLRELQVYMLENLRADHSVEALADRMGMSPRHFSRVCLREMKMNPGQFVDRLRVEAAQQMIDSSSKGLKEIADACGFGSADSMRRTFQRVIGITAGEYTERFKRVKP